MTAQDAPMNTADFNDNDAEETLMDPLKLSPAGKLLRHYLKGEGFGDHHVQVYDSWIFNNAANNVGVRPLVFPDGRVATFENLRILEPRYTRDGKVLPLTPKLAREQGVTYGSDWHVDVVMRTGPDGEEMDRRVSVCIGKVPTMLGSRKCILHGRTPRELAELGENPYDPMGYFIVDGVEKTILLQEQLAVNKIFLMNMDTKGSTVARMTANTARGTALIELVLDKRSRSIIKMRFPSMRAAGPSEKDKKQKKYKSINVLRIFRFLGVTDVTMIQNMIAMFMEPQNVKKSMLKLTRNIVDFSMITDDVEIIAAKMDKTKLSQEEKIKEVLRIFETDLFPHVNNLPGPDDETVQDRSNRIAVAKIYLLSIMIARFLEYQAGLRKLDDRDSWSNKRTEGAGRMMEQLFRNAWRKTRSIVQAAIDTGGVKDLGGVVEKIRYSIITDTFTDSFITSNWGVKGTQMKNNVAQTLVRDSGVATFAHINTVDVSISRTDRQQALRLVQNSQWGLICPVSTPEGENAGILKNLTVTAKVSLERSDSDIIRILIGDEAKGIPSHVSMNIEVRNVWQDMLMVNGKFLGWCDAAATRQFLIDLRRSGELPLDMSVILEGRWLYVDIGPSRLIHPVLIVDEDQTLAIDRLGLRDASNHELLTSGAMEYMSAWEQEYIKVAAKYEDITDRLKLFADADEVLQTAQRMYDAVARGEIVTENVDGVDVPITIQEAEIRLVSAREASERLSNNKPYTHCEIDPLAIVGIAAAMIPWPNHNQAPRNTYQVGMGKQALGVYHPNHLNRFDGKTKILAYPNRPMVESMMYDIIGLDENGPGENINIAFMALPFTEEDSFVFKKEFLDNGGFRIFKYLTYKTIVKHSGDVIETLARPEPRAGEPTDRYKYIQQAESGNPINGLPLIGAPMRQGDCVIGKVQHIPATKEVRNESSILRVGDDGVVEKVLVTSDNKITTVIVKLRVMRVPQEGDKFAPRNAQKGTIGLVVSDINLPVSADGIVPDMFVNPQSMPSRMTMAYPMECIAAKAGAMKGMHINGGAFQPFHLNEYRQILKDYGMNEYGYETMRSGTSGKPLEVPIYSSSCYVQALKHHVKDKVQARSKGPVKPMTRQPPKGRGNKGGLRFGEMERDAAISHGASAFLRERLMFVSDGYQTVFCATCGTFAINDAATKKYKPCRLCGSDNNFGRCTIPYAYKLLVHLLAAAGIFLRPHFMTSAQYADKVLNQRGGLTHGGLEAIREQLDEADIALGAEREEEQEEMMAEEEGIIEFEEEYD